MALIGMIDQIGCTRTMIAILMGRLGEEPQFMISWEAGSVCMTGLVTVSGIFPETKKSLKRWQMHEFMMNSYFAEMLMPIEWSQGKIVADQ